MNFKSGRTSEKATIISGLTTLINTELGAKR